MGNREELYLEKIAKELHQMNRVLERMSQAIIFARSAHEEFERGGVYLTDVIPQEKQSL